MTAYATTTMTTPVGTLTLLASDDGLRAVLWDGEPPGVRVPCSTMSTATLECYGICLTAGNLADNAWPESTRNFLRLLMSAHYHASNARHISTIAATRS